MHLLEIKNLSFRIGGQTIFDGLDLVIEPREIHALIGTNGSGESSLAYGILGCEGYAPADGEILFEGRIINTLRLYQRARLGMSLCWEEPARLEGISGANYVNLGKTAIEIDSGAELR